jgi:hypothetical protein
MLWTQAQMAQDTDLTARVAMCFATETRDDPQREDPQMWASQHRWEWATAPGWAAAWASALTNGSEAPGREPDVITDAMILSEVQRIMAAT